MVDLAKHVWKFQEGLLIVLLERLGVADTQIHWGKKPANVSVDTDIIIGKTESKPHAVILVTHNTADNSGGMKFWRSINELLELTAFYPNVLTANFHFESGVAPVTSLAMRKLFDESFSLSERDDCSSLVEVAHRVTQQHLLTASRAQVLAYMRDWVESAGKRHTECLEAVLSSLKRLVATRPRPRPWLTVCAPCNSIYDGWNGAHTGFRRGFAKIALLSMDQLKLLWGGASGQLIRTDLSELEPFGIIGPAHGGCRLIDKDVLQVIASPREWTLNVRQRVEKDMDALPRLRGQFSSVSALRSQAAWIQSHWKDVTNSKLLGDMLDDCFRDPASVGPAAATPVTWHWLLDFLIYLLKQARGSRHAFSLSKLSQELGAEGAIGRSNRLQFSYYIERKRDLPVQIRVSLAAKIAGLLKKTMSAEEVTANVGELIAIRAEGVMERMMNAQEFEPLYWLLADQCASMGVSFQLDKAIPSFVSDLHPKRPGTTKLALIGGLTVGSCVLAVHCRTAHDGATDKRKELCARARALRLRIAGDKTKAQLKDKLALVLDGDFSKKDAELLSKAGWSRIYPVMDMPILVSHCRHLMKGSGRG